MYVVERSAKSGRISASSARLCVIMMIAVCGVNVIDSSADHQSAGKHLIGFRKPIASRQSRPTIGDADMPAQRVAERAERLRIVAGAENHQSDKRTDVMNHRPLARPNWTLHAALVRHRSPKERKKGHNYLPVVDKASRKSSSPAKSV